MCPFVHCSIIYNSQDMETTKVSIDTRMAKDMYIHILLMGYYSAIKMNEILPLEITWMDLRVCAKWNKSDRERQIQYAVIYMWNLKNTAN